MRVSSPASLRFKADWVFKAKDLTPELRQKMVTSPGPTLGIYGASSQGPLQVHENLPEAGDVMVKVTHPRGEDRLKTYQGLMWAFERLGLPVTFMPDKPITPADREVMLTELDAHLATARQTLGEDPADPIRYKPQVNGEHLEFLAYSSRDAYRLHDALMQLLKQKVVTLQTGSFGAQHFEYKAHQVSVPLDPDSPHYPNMNEMAG